MATRVGEQQALFRRWPTGVSVVVAEAGGRRAALTVSTLLSLSLEPALIGVALSRSASLFEVLREAEEWCVSILAAGQEHLAQHFARNTPPIALWDRVAVSADDPRLLEGAVGWLVAVTVQEIEAGDHAVFVGALRRVVTGPGSGSLVYLDRRYVAL